MGVRLLFWGFEYVARAIDAGVTPIVQASMNGQTELLMAMANSNQAWKSRYVARRYVARTCLCQVDVTAERSDLSSWRYFNAFAPWAYGRKVGRLVPRSSCAETGQGTQSTEG